MIEVQELKLHQLCSLAVTLPAEERAVAEALSGEKFDPQRAAASLHLAPGMHFAFADSAGWAVAAGGFIPQGNGVFRTWFMAPESTWYAHGRELTRLVRELIRKMLEDGVARRIETITLADRTRARDWYTKIGLSFESTMRQYGAQGQEAVMYVAVKDV